MENKEAFFKACFRTDTQLKNYPYPIAAGEFNEETQRVTTLLSHFFGMDTEKYVTEPMMSLMFTLSTCPVELEEPI